jgi:hypothetical protein
MTLKCKLWEGGYIYFDNYSTEIFLLPQQAKYFVNWLNLHCDDLKNKKHIPTTQNKFVGMIFNSVNGFITIGTARDVFLCNYEDLIKIKKWINLHRKEIGCQEVLE